MLGKGSYGSVHKLVGEDKVVKLIDVSSLNTKHELEKVVKKVKREVTILKRLKNKKHVVRYYSIDTIIYNGKNYIGIVMEYIRGVELRKLLGKDIPSEIFQSIVKQIAQALLEIHELNIVHRDIKMNNIMVTKKGIVKLIDFGFSCYTSDLKPRCERRTMGTFDYMSPELLERQYDIEGLKSVDMWAVGVTLYSLANGRKPFAASSRSSLLKKILKGKYKKSQYPNKTINNIIDGCLTYDPYDRMTAEEMFIMSNS